MLTIIFNHFQTLNMFSKFNHTCLKNIFLHTTDNIPQYPPTYFYIHLTFIWLTGIFTDTHTGKHLQISLNSKYNPYIHPFCTLMVQYSPHMHPIRISNIQYASNHEAKKYEKLISAIFSIGFNRLLYIFSIGYNNVPK